VGPSWKTKSTPNRNQSATLYPRPTLRIHDNSTPPQKEKVTAHHRVSNNNQKDDPESQKQAPDTFRTARGLAADERLYDIGSALNLNNGFS